MEEHLIDVRDVDTSWFIDVRVWLDRDYDLYYLPQESVERLGETEDDGSVYLLDGTVPTRQEEIETSQGRTPVWAVPVHALTIRPSTPRRQ